ncbi:MAG: TonB-dependent receptor [Methylovulum sp.]|nr:TonB-dependent receptor [Methylovulum sp.]
MAILSKLPITVRCLIFSCCYSVSLVRADGAKIDDFFALSPAELAAIPVTIATGTPKPAFQSAAITSVITAEQIKAMGATELHEVLETVPGVHASIQDVFYDYTYSMRGISNSGNSQVLVLLNGTRITTPLRGGLMTGTELPIEAIQRVEVIRGPGSALYGADAFAGVINIITKKADDINGTKVGVRAGEWVTQSAWGQQSAHWAGWDLATSLQYQHTDGDGGRIIHADSQTAFDNAFGTQASHAPGAMNTDYETVNGHFNLQRKHWDIGLWAFNADWGARAGGANALDPKGAINGEQYLGDVRFSTADWFDNWELMAHVSYLHTYFLANVQLFPDNALLPIGSDGNIKSPFSNGPLVFFPDGVNSTSGREESIPAFELSSVYKGLNRHVLRMVSAFRYEQITVSESKNYGTGVINGSQPVVDGTLTNVTGTAFVYLPDTQRSIWSLVAQDEWSLADNWQLTTGVRYDDYSDFGDTMNPRAALVWDITEQLTSKLLYGKAFRAPSFSELGYQNNPVQLGNQHLKPEIIDTYEWAFDYRPFSSLRTAVNVYYYDIDNLISAVPDTNGVTSTFQNNGHQNGYGTEFEWDWHVLRQWNIRGNYAWQHAMNRSTERPVTGAPEHHVYVALGWHVSPQWQLQPQLNWIGGRTGEPGDNRALSDYETVDLTLRGKKLFKHLNLSASLRNAFDADARELAGMRLPENLPLQGRSFYFEASLEF